MKLIFIVSVLLLIFFFSPSVISHETVEEGQYFSSSNDNLLTDTIKEERKSIVFMLMRRAKNHNIMESLPYLSENIKIIHFFSSINGKEDVKTYLEKTTLSTSSWSSSVMSDGTVVLTGPGFGRRHIYFEFNKNQQIISIHGW